MSQQKLNDFISMFAEEKNHDQDYYDSDESDEDEIDVSNQYVKGNVGPRIVQH